MIEKNKIYTMKFAQIYPLLVQKVERKGRTKEEVNEIIYWLTGYDEKGLVDQLLNDVDYETFFNNAPCMNPNCFLIVGKVCGISVESIEDPIIQKARYLDKLIDELAKGRSMEKILRG